MPAPRTSARSGSPYEDLFAFSRGVRIGERVLAAGTAPIWPDGSCPDDADAQARRCFEIILDALGELGATADDVVRTRMYLVDREDAEAVGRVHGELFAVAKPAATMVVVAGLLRPEWRVEVEAEAVIGSAPVEAS